jgi:hypothetical protein
VPCNYSEALGTEVRMDSPDILKQATTIAKKARAKTRQDDVEQIVRAAEQSDQRALRSLARIYRMLQIPPAA